MFTKRHYEWLARFCKEQIDGSSTQDELDIKQEFVHFLASALKDHDPGFKREKFLTACGLRY